jgi:tetratricopeptide (TPR) repeat protein
MSKTIAVACLITILLVTQIGAFEVGETVVAIRECEFTEGKVVIKKAFVGEQFTVQRVDGRRLLLGRAASDWADNKDFLGLEEGVEHFSALIKKNPGDWQSLCARGSAREKLGQIHEGMSDLGEAIRLHPSCETYRRRARAFANRDMNQRALADFDEAIRRDPKSADTYCDRADLFFNQHEYKKALVEIEKALAIEPGSPFLLTCRGQLLLENKLLEKALQDADDALRIVPSYVHARRLKGSTLRTLNRKEEAIAEYSAVLQICPLDDQILNERGAVWYELNAPDRAIADFTKAIQVQPNPITYCLRAMAYSSAKRNQEAESDFSEALKLDQDRVGALMGRALIRLEMGKLKESLRDSEAAIKLDPDSVPCLMAHALALMECDRFEDVIKDCEKLVRLEPQFAVVYSTRGLAFCRLCRWKEAVEDLERALKLDYEQDEVLAEAAFIRAASPAKEIRNASVALRYAADAVRLSHGKSFSAHRAMAAALAANRDFPKAVDSSKQAIALASRNQKAEEEERLALYQARKPFLFK